MSPKRQQAGFLRGVKSTTIENDGTVLQHLACGHDVQLLALFQHPQRGPILPCNRYCELCHVLAAKREKRKRRAAA